MVSAIAMEEAFDQAEKNRKERELRAKRDKRLKNLFGGK